MTFWDVILIDLCLDVAMIAAFFGVRAALRARNRSPHVCEPGKCHPEVGYHGP